MLVLALDTTSRHGSLALARNGTVLDAVAVEAPGGFAQIVFQEIDKLLKRHGVSFANIGCYAAAAGPGSFTGIRVGLTAVKALAEVHGKPVVAVSTLQGLASLAQGRYRAPVIDARRGEVFTAVYDDQLRPVIQEAAVAWPVFLQSLAGREITFIGQTADIFEQGGAAEWNAARDSNGNSNWRRVEAGEPLAAAVARLATKRLARGEALPAEAADANYVRRSDAELKWKDPA
jgi:tRNA threonylcarbamoyladenosine biosynthesis protein TsaB